MTQTILHHILISKIKQKLKILQKEMGISYLMKEPLKCEGTKSKNLERNQLEKFFQTSPIQDQGRLK